MDSLPPVHFSQQKWPLLFGLFFESASVYLWSDITYRHSNNGSAISIPPKTWLRRKRKPGLHMRTIYNKLDAACSIGKHANNLSTKSLKCHVQALHTPIHKNAPHANTIQYNSCNIKQPFDRIPKAQQYLYWAASSHRLLEMCFAAARHKARYFY